MPPTPMNSQQHRAALRGRREQEHQRGEPDRQRGAAEEEIGHRARIVDAGQDHPAAQHLHLFAVAAGVVLGGVFDHPLRGLQARMPQRARAAAVARRRPAPMPAARRLTEPCTRTSAMTQNAKRGRRQEHQHRHHRRIAGAEHVHRSDLEVDHAVHDEVADPHPAGRAGRARSWSGPRARRWRRTPAPRPARSGTSRSAATTGSSPRRGLRRRARGSCAAS